MVDWWLCMTTMVVAVFSSCIWLVISLRQRLDLLAKQVVSLQKELAGMHERQAQIQRELVKGFEDMPTKEDPHRLVRDEFTDHFHSLDSTHPRRNSNEIMQRFIRMNHESSHTDEEGSNIFSMSDVLSSVEAWSDLEADADEPFSPILEDIPQGIPLRRCSSDPSKLRFHVESANGDMGQPQIVSSGSGKRYVPVRGGKNLKEPQFMKSILKHASSLSDVIVDRRNSAPLQAIREGSKRVQFQEPGSKERKPSKARARSQKMAHRNAMLSGKLFSVEAPSSDEEWLSYEAMSVHDYVAFGNANVVTSHSSMQSLSEGDDDVDPPNSRGASAAFPPRTVPLPTVPPSPEVSSSDQSSLPPPQNSTTTASSDDTVSLVYSFFPACVDEQASRRASPRASSRFRRARPATDFPQMPPPPPTPVSTPAHLEIDEEEDLTVMSGEETAASSIKASPSAIHIILRRLDNLDAIVRQIKLSHLGLPAFVSKDEPN